MIEIHSLTTLIATETIVVLLLALALVIFGAYRRKHSERNRAGEFVDKINESEGVRLQNLEGKLLESGKLLPEDARRQVLKAVSQKEKELYRHVIQAFLTRDTAKLTELDHYVQALSEPYFRLVKLLIDGSSKDGQSAFQDKLALAEITAQQAQVEAEQARAETQRTKEELEQAVTALDEVSKEYARMFGEPKTAEQLHESRQRMLDAFRRAERLAGGDLIPELQTTATPRLGGFHE